MQGTARDRSTNAVSSTAPGVDVWPSRDSVARTPFVRVSDLSDHGCAPVEGGTIPLAWFAALFFLAGLVPQPPVRVALRVRVNEGPGATADDVARISAALNRGFYTDSIVVPPAETLHLDRQPLPMPDSARRERIGYTVLVRGSVGATGLFLEVRMRLVDLLMKPLGGEDTVRLQRAEIESEFAKRGRGYAVLLSERFRR